MFVPLISEIRFGEVVIAGGVCQLLSRQLSLCEEMQLGLVTAAYQGIATLLNTRQRAFAKVRFNEISVTKANSDTEQLVQ